MDLRVLAHKLEKSSDDLLVKASTKSPAVFQKVATAIAAASTLLEGVADDMDNNASFEITPQQLDEIAALASAFDESGDPLLKKQASVLDELLLSIASPKNALAVARKTTEDEINRLRVERRKARGEEAYDEPRKVLSNVENAKEQAKAVEQQVKRYIPMEAPLQTRYPPDRPGGQMTRITDHVYQDIVTGIIYDYKAGYKTQKGNEVPGGSVEAQTHELGDIRDRGTSMFETRDSLMGRYASDDSQKPAIEKIANVLTAIRDHAPGLLDRAIDNAMISGLTTTQVATILASNISEEGLKVIADESDKKKREPLKSNITTISRKESEHEYNNAKSVLRPLLEMAKEDPAHANLWFRMMEDNLEALRDIGMDQIHLSLLYGEFLSPKATEGSATAPPPPMYSLVEKMDVPEAHSDTMRAGRIARQSLTAMVLNAIQELAPHLLKSAIVKARAEGLDDSQIKSVLASDFHNKFDKPANEIKTAESLFPHLKDLGWNDLVNKHISVMGSLGVNTAELKKIAEKYGPADVKSLGKLAGVLKNAGVEELDLGDVPEGQLELQEPISTVPIIDEPVNEPPKLTSAKMPILATQVIDTILAQLKDPNERANLKMRYKGQDLLERMIYAEVNRHRNEMNDEMFSAFYHMVSEGVKYVLPSEPMPKPEVIHVPEAKLQSNKYDEDSEEYQAALEEVENFIKTDESARKALTDIYNAEVAKAKKEFKKINPNKTRASQIYAEMVRRVTDRIVSGQDTPTNAEILEGIFAENRKVNYPPWLTKVKSKELVKSREETPEEFEDRKHQSLVQPLAQKHLELGDTVVEEKSLSEDKPAQNSEKHKYLHWGDYNTQTGADVDEVQANELETKISDNISEQRKKLEQVFQNFVYKSESIPDSITNLPDGVRKVVQDMLGRGENPFAVSKYLIDLKTTDKTQSYQTPSIKDLRHFVYMGSDRKKEVEDFRVQMIGRVMRRTINSALEEAGLPPMYQSQENDDMDNDAVYKQISTIMGETRGKESFIKPIPIGPKGKKLIPFWEAPTAYYEAYREVWRDHPNPLGPKSRFLPKEIRDEQDDAMVDMGFLSPSDKFIGRTNSRMMLGGIDSDVKGNLLSNFTKPGTNEQYKTLFSDMEEYTKAYFEAKAQFRTEFRPKPKEWFEIIGTQGNEISDIPIRITSKILPLISQGKRMNELVEAGAAIGADPETVGRISAYAKQSGNKIRGYIMHMILKDEPASLEEIKAELDKKYPGAVIPEQVIEYVYYSMLADQEDRKEDQEKQNEWMKERGFYPPYQIAVGNKTFAQILSPRKKGGKGGTMPDDATPLEQLEQQVTKQPRKQTRTNISKPTSHLTQPQRQPGTGGEGISALAPFMKARK